jgi:Cd2+/Zn2+-exporting ATPase
MGSAALAALLCGWKTLKEGFRSLLHLRADEELLMTIAVIAAFLIGEYTEGALVAVLFSLGEKLEEAAVGRSEREIKALANIRPDTATS